MSTGNFLVALWVRLALVVIFGVFVAWQQMWFLTALAALIVVVTVVQLVFAYRDN